MVGPSGGVSQALMINGRAAQNVALILILLPEANEITAANGLRATPSRLHVRPNGPAPRQHPDRRRRYRSRAARHIERRSRPNDLVPRHSRAPRERGPPPL